LRPGEASDMTRSLDDDEFQSAPGLEAGRSGKIAPALKEWALFQSAPGLEAGRSDGALIFRGHESQFQSAPGLEAGRSANIERYGYRIIVSIRARP